MKSKGCEIVPGKNSMTKQQETDWGNECNIHQNICSNLQQLTTNWTTKYVQQTSACADTTSLSSYDAREFDPCWSIFIVCSAASCTTGSSVGTVCMPEGGPHLWRTPRGTPTWYHRRSMFRNWVVCFLCKRNRKRNQEDVTPPCLPFPFP